MSISVIKDQEMVLRLLKSKDLFEEYFQPLVGLPQSDNHHGMDAMQHTVAVVRSIENVLNELDKTQGKRYTANDIMSLHIAALFHDTGKAVVKVEVRPNEFDYKGHAEESVRLLWKFYKVIESRLSSDVCRRFRLASWLIAEHTNFHMAIKNDNLHKWIVDNIRSGHFKSMLSYKDMINALIVLSASDAAAKYAVCGDEYHDAVVRYTAERHSVMAKVERMNIPVHDRDLKTDCDLDQGESYYILRLCWDGEIQNNSEQIAEALEQYRNKKKYTVSLEY